MRNPIWVSGHYRWRKDDGSLSTATWYAAEDTSASIPVDTPFRLRINWGDSNNQSEGVSIAPYLQYRINSGSWVTVGAATAVKYTASGQSITDGTADSADRITTPPTGVPTSASTQEFDDNNATTARAYANTYGELEFCLEMDSASVSGGDSVEFQLVYSGDTAFSSYDTTPTTTALSPVTVNANAGALSLAAQNAAVTLSLTVTAGAGALSLAAQNASANTETSFTAGAGALSLAAQNASANTETSFTAGAGALSLAAQNATITASVTVTAGAGSLSLAAQNVSPKADVTLTTNMGQQLLADPEFDNPADWVVLSGWTVSGGQASYNGSLLGRIYAQEYSFVVTGEVYLYEVKCDAISNCFAARLGNANGSIHSTTGVFTGTITAAATSPQNTGVVTCAHADTGTWDYVRFWKRDINLKGQAATVSVAVNVVANSVSLSLAAQNASANVETAFTASSASLSLAAQNADVSVTTAVVVNASSASLSLAAQNASANVETAFTASSASLSLAAQNASANVETAFTASSASLSLAAQNASANVETAFTASSASLSLATQNASANVETAFTASSASLSLATQNAVVSVVENIVVDAAAASLSLAAQNVGYNFATSLETNMGQQLLADPEFDNPTDWVVLSGWTVSGGQASYNGSLLGRIYAQEYSFVVTGEVYLYEVKCDAISNCFAARLGNANGSIHSATGVFTGTITASATSPQNTGVVTCAHADTGTWDYVRFWKRDINLKGQAASVVVDTAFVSGTAGLSLAPQSAVINAETAFVANAGALTVTPQAADVSVVTGIQVDCAAAPVSLSAQNASVYIEQIVSAQSATLYSTSFATTVTEDTGLGAQAGALSLVAHNASVFNPTTLVATDEALTLSPLQADLNVSTGVSAGASALTLEGQNAALSVDTSVSATSTSFGLAGQAATATNHTVLSAGSAGLNLTGQNAAVVAAIGATAGEFTVAPQNANVSVVLGITVNAASISFSLVAQQVGLKADVTFATKTGVQLIPDSEFDASDSWILSTGWSINNGKASYDGSGTAKLFLQDTSDIVTGFVYNYEVKCDAISNCFAARIGNQNGGIKLSPGVYSGSITAGAIPTNSGLVTCAWGDTGTWDYFRLWRRDIKLVGQAVNINESIVVNASAAALSLTPLVADANTEVSFVSSAAGLALAGQPANVTVPSAVVVSAGSGSLSVAGQSADTNIAVSFTGNAGALSLLGQQTTLLTDITFTASGVALSLAGQAATVSPGQSIFANAGALTVSGQTASINVETAVSAASQAISLAGQSVLVELQSEVIVQAQSATLAFGPQTAALNTATSLTTNMSEQLFADSEMDNAADWVVATGWSVSGGVASYDGTGTGKLFAQNTDFIAQGYAYDFEVKCDAISNCYALRLGNTNSGIRSTVGIFTGTVIAGSIPANTGVVLCAFGDTGTWDYARLWRRDRVLSGQPATVNVATQVSCTSASVSLTGQNATIALLRGFMPVGIASAEAIPQPSVSVFDLQLEPVYVSTAEDVRTPKVRHSLPSVGGVASQETWGTTQLNHGVFASGLASQQAFGAARPTHNLGAVGIPSEETVGTCRATQELDETSIPTAEIFGSVALTLRLSPVGLPGGEAFGSFSTGAVVYGAGIASAEAIPAPQVAGPVVVTGIPSEEAFGAVTLLPDIAPVGMPSDEVFGSAGIELSIKVPYGVYEYTVFGQPQLSQSYTISFAISEHRIPSAEAFGQPAVLGEFSVVPQDASLTGEIGTPSLQQHHVVSASDSTAVPSIPDVEADFSQYMVSEGAYSTPTGDSPTIYQTHVVVSLPITSQQSVSSIHLGGESYFSSPGVASATVKTGLRVVTKGITTRKVKSWKGKVAI